MSRPDPAARFVAFARKFNAEIKARREERRARRDAADADDAVELLKWAWEKQAEKHKMPGQRLGRHRATKPGDIPDQPAGGAE